MYYLLRNYCEIFSLQKYYESSYGHPINSAMACPLVKDIFQTMDNAMNSSWNYDNLGNMTNTRYSRNICISSYFAWERVGVVYTRT